MTFESILAIVLIALVVGGALTYVILAKKRGQKCIGCPYAKSCGGACGCSAPKDTPAEK